MRYKWLKRIGDGFTSDKHTSNIFINIDDVKDIGDVRIAIEEKQCGMPLKEPYITIGINEYSISMDLSVFLKKIMA